MQQRKRNRIATAVLYCILLSGIIWNSTALIDFFRPQSKLSVLPAQRVMVSGDVRRPGTYLVPEGTTQFEILKVAGVRPTSDLSSFNLMAQIDSGTMVVNSRETPVSLNSSTMDVRLEFYYGEISLVSPEGISRPIQDGVLVSNGDRVITETSSQAEFSVGTYSRVDVDNLSELIFDKINIREENNAVTEMFQKAGICWYKIVYTEKTDQIRTLTPLTKLIVGGSGADFLVDVRIDQTIVNVIDGILLVERTGETEAINLIAGQTATIYNDGRPIQVTRLSSDISAQQRFSLLAQEKTNYMMRNMPLNFLFCGIPSTFFFVNVQFNTGKINVVHIPSEMLTEQFSPGIQTLDQAFLYGGAAFASTIAERLLSQKITKYFVFEKYDVLRTVAALGGVSVSVDNVAASALNMPSGNQKLNDAFLARFLSPEISGPADSRHRQIEVLRSLFDGFRSKNIVLTALLADQILANIESNFSSGELMQQYDKFNSRSGWSFKEYQFPAQATRCGTRVCYEPMLEEAAKLLQ